MDSSTPPTPPPCPTLNFIPPQISIGTCSITPGQERTSAVLPPPFSRVFGCTIETRANGQVVTVDPSKDICDQFPRDTIITQTQVDYFQDVRAKFRTYRFVEDCIIPGVGFVECGCTVDSEFGIGFLCDVRTGAPKVINDFKISDECPGHLTLTISQGGLSATAPIIAAGGVKGSSVHQKSFILEAQDPETSYLVQLDGPRGGDLDPVVELGDGQEIKAGASTVLQGSRTLTVRSGDQVGECVLTVKNGSTARFTIPMVKGLITLPDQLCADGRNAGRVKLTYNDIAIDGHVLELKAEGLEPPTGTVTLTQGRVTSDTDAQGKSFEVQPTDVSKFKIRATDLTVFDDGVNPTAVSEALTPCEPKIKIEVGAGGLPDDVPAPPDGPANLVAGGVDDDMHRRHFTIKASDDLKYTLSLSGRAASSGQQAGVTVGTSSLALEGAIACELSASVRGQQEGTGVGAPR